VQNTCIVLTGSMGSGKTTTLRSLMESLGAEGRCVCAVLQTADARRPDGRAFGFSMAFLSACDGNRTCRSEQLARELAPGEILQDGMIGFGRFSFDTAVFLKAQEFIQTGMAGPPRADIVGIDEIGRLELFRDGGLRNTLDSALKHVGRSKVPLIVLSVREDCVPDLRRLVEAAGVETVLVEKLDIDAIMRLVRSRLDILLGQDREL
jgi:nucleoside-triphosphatase THEP1